MEVVVLNHLFLRRERKGTKLYLPGYFELALFLELIDIRHLFSTPQRLAKFYSLTAGYLFN